MNEWQVPLGAGRNATLFIAGREVMAIGAALVVLPIWKGGG